MFLEFNEDHKAAELNKIELEDVLIYAETMEGNEKNWRLKGTAIIDEEKYNDFILEFELENVPESYTTENIINSEWEWYDYIFE